MAYHSGLELKAVFTKGITWGTAVAAAGAKRVLLRTPGGLARDTNFVDDIALGQSWSRFAFGGLRQVRGSPVFDLRYGGMEMAILAHALGSEDASPTLLTTGVYGQTITPAVNSSNVFGTFAYCDGVNVRQYASAKVGGFRLRGEQGQGLLLTPEMICWDEERGAALVNTVATIENCTHLQTSNIIETADSILRMNAQAGAALSAANAIGYSSFELAFTRPLEVQYAQSPASVAGNARCVEPATDGECGAVLQLRFPFWEGNTYWAMFDTEAPQKLDLTFTGSVISGGYSRSMRIQSPYAMVVKEESSLPGPGAIPENLTLKLYGVTTAPTGMSTTAPFDIYTVSALAAGYLTL